MVKEPTTRGKEQNDVSLSAHAPPNLFVEISVCMVYRTYDEYSTELESGLLHWSPPHTSDEFWSENADKLNIKDHQQLKYAIIPYRFLGM